MAFFGLFGKKKELTEKEKDSLKQAAALLRKTQEEIKNNKLGEAKRSADDAQKMISKIDKGDISATIITGVIHNLNKNETSKAHGYASIAGARINELIKK